MLSYTTEVIHFFRSDSSYGNNISVIYKYYIIYTEEHCNVNCINDKFNYRMTELSLILSDS